MISNMSFVDTALFLVVSWSGLSLISVKVSGCHSSSGCGLIISSLLSLLMSIVFNASANGKYMYNPILFLQF